MAETYDGPLPPNITLTDTSAVINRHVNQKLLAARSKAPRSPKLEEEVYNQLGFPWNPAYARIESWANGLQEAVPGVEGQIYKPQNSDSQYKGRSGLASFLAPVMNVNGVLIGTDKVGHFFQIAYSHYYKPTLQGKSLADALNEGDKTEASTFGIDNTGVYSNADIAANRAGLQFYQDLARNPGLTFQIEKYLSFKWNEASNANLHGGELANMWVRNLNGLWQGHSFDDATRSMVQCSLSLKITERQVGSFLDGHPEYDLVGIYTYGATTSLGGDGKLVGSAKNNFNASNAVDEVKLEFKWSEGAASGEGTLKQVAMNQLSGRWGNVKSPHDGGAWNLFKVTNNLS